MNPEKAYEQAQKAGENKEKRLQEEKDRFRELKKEHKKNKQDIKEDYEEDIRQILKETGITELEQKAEKIQHLKDTRTELRDSILQKYRENVSRLIESERITVNHDITFREGEIHKYNKKHHTKIKKLSKVLRNLERITREVKKAGEPHKQIIEEANEQLQKLPVKQDSKVAKYVIQEEIAVNYTSNQPNKIYFATPEEFKQDKIPENPTIMYAAREQNINGSTTTHLDNGYNPDEIKRTIKYRDTVEQLMNEVENKLKENIQELKEANLKIGEIFSEHVVAKQL